MTTVDRALDPIHDRTHDRTQDRTQDRSLDRAPDRIADRASDRTEVVLWSEVSTEPLDTAAARSRVADARSGAVVLFEGVVRDHDHTRSVTMIEYEGHPSADDVMRAAAAEVARAHPEVTGIVVLHRLGPLQVGEVALVAAVACPHRAEAFAACAALVDEVKRVLPVWKRQVFTDGTDEWVNCP